MRVVVLSDLNSSYGSMSYEPEVGQAVERTVEEWRPDLVLIAGDMVAGQRPALDDERVQAMWVAFDSVVAAPLRRAGIPLAVTMGNHDASGHPGHERDRRIAAEYWRERRPDVQPLLHAGALGQCARPLLEHDAAPAQTVTVLDLFPAADSLSERTYRVHAGVCEAVDPATLPLRLDGINGHVVRRDVTVDRAPSRRDTTHTIVSFNIRAGTDLEGRPNLDRVAALLDTLNADVVLLQEVDRGTRRSGGVDQLAELRRLTGMHGRFGRAIDFDGGEYGIGLLSRWPVAETAVVPLTAGLPGDLADPAYEARVLLYVVLDSPWGSLPVLNTHLGTGAGGTYRRQELVGLLAELHRRAGRSGMAIVGGDFNARPESDEIAAVTLSLRDAWSLCGDGPGWTFRSDEPTRRIDYIFLRAADCTAARVPATTISDHRPLVVEVRPARETGPAAAPDA